jgi:hypothetical protein
LPNYKIFFSLFPIIFLYDILFKLSHDLMKPYASILSLNNVLFGIGTLILFFYIELEFPPSPVPIPNNPRLLFPPAKQKPFILKFLFFILGVDISPDLSKQFFFS